MGIKFRTIETLAKYAEKCSTGSILQTKLAKSNRTIADGFKLLSKPKVPPYLYHMTTPENYQKMLGSQTLKATKDSFFGNGVFMFELKNLFKQWNGSEAWGAQSLKFQLINHARKQGNSIVLLKIPTGKIADKLKIRSQEELFKYCKDKKRFLLDKHLLNGAKAKDTEAFKSQSIEYIYPKNIDMNSVEKVGEVNILDLQQLASYDKTKPLKSFFTTLFNGHPEQKTAEAILNC